MPSLGADMDAGTVLEWRVQPGDVVHRGDIVAVVDTEKSDIEVEVFEDGVVEELLVAVGEEVAVGTPLARLGPVTGAGAAAPEAPAPPASEAELRSEAEPPVEPEPAAEAAAVTDVEPEPAAEPVATAGAEPAPKAKATRERGRRTGTAEPVTASEGRVRASPRARQMAAEAGVDLTTVAGSGPGGAIVAGDLSKPGPRPPSPERPGSAEVPPGSHAEPGRPTERSSAERQAAMRHAIGELMARSTREIPHYHLATTVDLSAALTWLRTRNEARSVNERVLPAALLLKATALALREVPSLNGFWVDDGFRAADGVHLGVAVSLRGGGLVAPALHDADRRSLEEVMAGLKDLVERARGGRLRASEMSDPTLTVTNLGDQGADEVLGVIYPPQVALVGFGRIVERPWAVDGMLGVRPTVRATLAADHRASDGATGSKLLAAIERLLQRPEDL
jgi:pyruvate dehydrogenase E2 component (dihydrolipoamide acetyltransferase)